ncbi:alpha/beta fold hydrolase, partial [Candidatus Hydrogenedentota bacterium]
GFINHKQAFVTPRKLRKVVEMGGKFDVGDLVQGLDYLSTSDFRAELTQLTMPALVIHGSDDAIMPVSCGQYLAQNISNVSYKELPGKGHAILHTAASDISDSIRTFLDANCSE